MGKIAKTYEEVKREFELRNYELLETEYKGSHYKLKYKCKKHPDKELSIKFHHLMDNHGCPVCGREKVTEQQKHSFEYVKQYFEDHRCTLLEKHYINSRTKMKYICECGNISYITFDSFQRETRCKECGIEKCADQRRLSYEEVKIIFESGKCTLLETDYIGNDVPMKYICECGNIAYITLVHFQRGDRCSNCRRKRKSEKISGSKNYQWNPNLTDEDRQIKRNTFEYRHWCKEIYKKDDYICQCCNKRGGKFLNAHHLYNWADYPELRYDTDNGTTLCRDCHILFHTQYGKIKNTPEQFFEFKNNQTELQQIM